MVLYIIRHGDPDYEHNTITPYGHKEAKALAEWFDGRVRFDRIYSSPLGRAKDTAFYTCEKQGVSPVILPWAEESMDYMRPFSKEANCSYRFTGKDGVTDFEDYHDEDRHETLCRLQTSADELLAQLGYVREGAHYRVETNIEETVALFCHGGFGTALTAYLLGMPPALGFPSMFMSTSSYNVITLRNHESGYTRPRLIRFGDTTHLSKAGILDDRL